MPNNLQKNTPLIAGEASDVTMLLDAQGQIKHVDTHEILYSAQSLERQTSGKSVLAEPDVVWVSTELVLIHEQFVPGKRASDCAKALPFVLEAQLSLPVEDYFLLVLDKAKQQQGLIDGVTFTVAIVRHEIMALWQTTLNYLAWSSVLLIPDCFRLPNVPNTVTQFCSSVAQNSDQQAICWLRYGDFKGLVTQQQWLSVLENKLAADLAEFEKRTISQEDLLTSNLQNLPAGEKFVLRKCNLRQGDYAARNTSSLLKSGILTTVLLGGVLGFLGVWQYHDHTQKMQQQAEVYQAQTKALFAQMFPDVKRVVNIKAQTLSRLKGASESSGQVNLIDWLSKVESLLAQVPEVKVVLLNWDASKQHLKLALTASSSAQMTRLNALAKEVNLPLEIATKKIQPNQVEAELHVRQPK